MGAVRASHPRFRREGKAPPIELTKDDAAILHRVFRHRFIRADDLYRLFGDRSADRLSRRLRNEFLDRPIAQIDRYHVGGSRALVYGLGNAGARYLKEQGLSIGATDWRSRNRTYTRENLDHTLAVSRFLIDLELACRERPELELIPFEEILARSPEATRRSRNPMSWPVPVQWHGARAVVHIAPDAIFGLRIKRQDQKSLVSYFFLEIDRGTMTIVPSERVRESDAFPYRATILRKLYAYADSFLLKCHEERFGVRAPRVVLCTSSETRAKGIRGAVAEFVTKNKLASSELFVVIDQHSALPRSLLRNFDSLI
jgi:protein involved in plasmid replication-relaxation